MIVFRMLIGMSLLFLWPVWATLNSRFILAKPSGGFMAFRKPVNKRRSASNFRRNVAVTKSVNLAPAPMRGGYRM